MRTTLLISAVFFLEPLARAAAPPAPAPVQAQAPAPVEFEFVWKQLGTPLELRLYRAPLSAGGHVGEHGPLANPSSLQITKALNDNRLVLQPNEEAILYLVARNPTDREVRFAVAPHQAEPIENSIGFAFRCLCYNHVYKVKGQGFWYRVLSIRAEPGQVGRKVRLTHEIFPVKPEPVGRPAKSS